MTSLRPSTAINQLLTAAVVILGSQSPLEASEYYFSAAGSYTSGNGSLANPWRSIAKFNTLDLNPGDSALFRRGDMFDGMLFLNSGDTGADSQGNLIAPVVVGSYGSGAGTRAVIRSPTNQPSLFAQNNGGIELRDLEFLNGGNYSSNPGSGVYFEITQNASGGLTHFEHIRIDNVVARGFHQSGLSLYAANNVGYEDVQITGSEFYNNQFSGVEMSAANWTDLVHRDVHVDQVVSHHNPGYSGCSPHCGHGVVLGQVDGAVIEHSIAHSNGITAGKGNVGLWAWQSNEVSIQFNQAYDNRSPLGADGGGFDLDGGVTNSIVQYNVSRDNDGAGYLLAEFEYAEPMSQNVFRYNLSVNDGRDGYGAITVWGATPGYVAGSTVFHNNTVVVRDAEAPNSRGPVWFLDNHHVDIDFINNIFVALDGASLIEGSTTPAKASFVNNAYWTDGAPLRIGNVVYGSIAAWTAASGQEKINGQFVGLQADPEFLAEDTFRLANSSGLIDAGLTFGGTPWPAWLAGVGPHDLYAQPVPRGIAIDVGATEFQPLPGDSNQDGIVDVADYHSWRSKFAQLAAIGTPADGNGDGFIDAAEYTVWRKFADSISLASGASPSVPEPFGSTLFAAGCCGLWLGGRNRGPKRNPDERHQHVHPTGIEERDRVQKERKLSQCWTRRAWRVVIIKLRQPNLRCRLLTMCRDEFRQRLQRRPGHFWPEVPKV